MIISEKITTKILLLAVVMLPFNGTLLVDALSRISKHGQTYPVLLLVAFGVCVCLLNRKIFLPSKKDTIIYLLFVGGVLLSGIMNALSLQELMFQGKNGVDNYLVCLIKFLLFYIVPFAIINVFHSYKKSLLEIFERGVNASIVIVLLYSIVELLFLIGLPIGIEIKGYIDANIINFGSESSNIIDVTQMMRVHSVASEASYFAMYVIFVIPYIIKRCIEKSSCKSVYLLLFLYFTLLLILSFSRTAYFGYALTTMFTIITAHKYINVKKIILLGFMAVLLIVFFIVYNYDWTTMAINVLTSFDSDSGFSGSNAARFGSTIAALKIFVDYPICGVGWGGFGFYASNYYPQWAWISQELTVWSSNTVINGAWPPVHNLYAKLLAETGMIGFLFFMILFIRCASLIYKQYKLAENEKKLSWIAFGAAFFSLLIGAFNVDTIYYVYWIMVGILWHEYKLIIDMTL